MAFVLFILINSVLFIRPAELIASLEGMPIYEFLVIGCLLATLPRVLNQLSGQWLVIRPITVCVLGLLGAVMMSHLSHLSIHAARSCGYDFAKVVIYYLLLVATVDTPARLRTLLFWLATFTFAVTVLALLEYHGYIDIPALQAYPESTGKLNPLTGQFIMLFRLRGAGIFNDPNDLCLILLLGGMICLYGCTERRRGLVRYLCLVPLAVFVYALYLTHSRGGFLAAVAAGVTLLTCRYGWRKTLPMLAAMPVLFAIIGTRQTNISAGSGTGQERIQLWAYALSMLKGSPLFGIGMGRFGEEVGLVAHNSFVHAFVELGFVGGGLFLGAFIYAFISFRMLAKQEGGIVHSQMRRLWPFLLATIVGYAAGCLFLSRVYTVTTYLMLGLATVFLRVTWVDKPVELPKVNSIFVQRIAVASVAFVTVTYVFVRVFARWGGG